MPHSPRDSQNCLLSRLAVPAVCAHAEIHHPLARPISGRLYPATMDNAPDRRAVTGHREPIAGAYRRSHGDRRPSQAAGPTRARASRSPIPSGHRRRRLRRSPRNRIRVPREGAVLGASPGSVSVDIVLSPTGAPFFGGVGWGRGSMLRANANRSGSRFPLWKRTRGLGGSGDGGRGRVRSVVLRGAGFMAPTRPLVAC